MSRVLHILLPALTLGACTELRLPPQDPPQTTVSPAASVSIKKMVPFGSKVVQTSGGFLALGCADPSQSNFCFSNISADGKVLSQAGDLPKIAAGLNSYTVATGLAFLPPNDVIIVGSTTGNLGELQGGEGDGFIARYTLDGRRVWIKQFGQNTLGLGSNQREDFFDVTVDSSGNSYVVGRTRSNFDGTNAGNFDALLIKVNAAGDLVFKKQAGSLNDDEFKRVALNPQGQVIVAGHTCGSWVETNAGPVVAQASASLGCPSDQSYDLVIGAFSSTDGSVLFRKQLGRSTLPGGKGAGTDLVFGLAVSAAGDLYLTGATSSTFALSSNATLNADTAGGLTDIFVAKLNSLGGLSWIKTWGVMTPGSFKVDVGKAILIQEETSELLVCAETYGNLLEAQGGGAVTGVSSSTGKGDLVLIRMSQSGSVVKQVQYGNVTLGSGRAGQQETCGTLLRSQNDVILFGTSKSALFGTGSGTGFMDRDSLTAFTEMFKADR